MADLSGDLALGGEPRGTVYWSHQLSLLPRLYRSPLFLSPPFSSPQPSPAADPAIPGRGPCTSGYAVPERRHRWRASHRSGRLRSAAPGARPSAPAPPSGPRPNRRPRTRPCRRSTPPLCNHDTPMEAPQNNSSGQMIEVVNISSSSLSASEHVSSSEDDMETPSYILKRDTELTDVQNKEMEVKVQSIRSTIPVFGCIMRSSSLCGKSCGLNFSREYSDVYLPPGMQTLMLQRHGKYWKVQCVDRPELSKRLQRGWKDFADDNNLQLGDLCLFELLENEKQAMKVHGFLIMNVHVIREK